MSKLTVVSKDFDNGALVFFIHFSIIFASEISFRCFGSWVMNRFFEKMKVNSNLDETAVIITNVGP